MPVSETPMLPLPTLVTDASGTVLRANEAARALLGDCVGRPCADVVAAVSHDGAHRCAAGCATGLCATEGAQRLAGTAAGGQVAAVTCSAIGAEVVVLIDAVTDEPLPRQLPTARELEVLALVADGLTTARIARRLDLSFATVRTHLEHVREKLEVRSRAEAVARATALGLLPRSPTG